MLKRVDCIKKPGLINAWQLSYLLQSAETLSILQKTIGLEVSTKNHDYTKYQQV